MVWYLYGKPAYNGAPDFANLRIGLMSTSEGQQAEKPLDADALDDLRRKSSKHVRRFDRAVVATGNTSGSLTEGTQGNVHVFEKKRTEPTETEILEKLATASEKHYLFVRGSGRYEEDSEVFADAEDRFEENIKQYIDHLEEKAAHFRRR